MKIDRRTALVAAAGAGSRRAAAHALAGSGAWVFATDAIYAGRAP